MSAVAQVEVTLKDNLSGKLKDATQAVKETADAEKKAAQAAKELAKEQEQIAKAARRLEDLANRGNDISRLATELRRTKAEITELARKTGDEATAARATAAAEAQFAAKLQALQDAQKQAAAGADDLASAEGRAADAAEHAAHGADRAADGFGKIGETAGKAGGALEMMGIEGAQTAADLADMGEVVSQALAGMGLSLEAAGAVMAGMASVVVVAYGAWSYYAGRAEHAKEAQDRLNASLKAGQEAAGRIASIVDELAVATGNMSEEEASYRAKKAQADRDREASMSAIEEETGLTKKQIEAAVMAADASKEAANSLSLAQKQAVDAVKRTNAEYDATVGLAGQLRDEQIKQKKASEDKDAADRAAEEAARRRSEQDREAEQAIKDRIAAIKLLADTIASADPVSQENRRYELQVQSIQEAIRLSGDQEEGQRALNVALAEHEERLQAIADQQKKKAEDAEKAAAAEKKQIQDAAQAEQDRLRKEAELKARLAAEEEARKRQKATGTVDMVGSVMGGGFAALGWIGQIIQAVIGLVTGIVDETGNGIIDKLHETMMEFFSDLGGLGAELADSMLRSVVEGIPAAFQGIAGLLGGLLAEDSLKAILEGSARMIPEILVAVFRLIIADVPRIVAELIRTIFSKEFWVDVLKGFADGIKEAFKGLVGANSDQSKGGRVVAGVATLGLSEALRAATKGRYATGAGNIREDGLYYLHKGETAIVPSNGVQPSSRPSGGGVNVVVNISGYMASNTEDLARTIRQAVNRGVKLA